METLTLEHLPADYAVHLALFKNVKNAAFLHAQLLARNPEFEYAFIDASIVSLLFGACSSPPVRSAQETLRSLPLL